VQAAELDAVKSMTHFADEELSRLYSLFEAKQQAGLVSQAQFWQLTCCPILLWNHDSLLNLRMFTIFDVLKLGALTFLEFSLAFGVLSGNATFLEPATFVFDVLDLKGDGRLDLDELRACLESVAVDGWATATPPDIHSVRPVGVPSHMVLSPLQYLRSWVAAFLEIDAVLKHGSLDKDQLAQLLRTHPSAPLLWWPFRLDLPALFLREGV